MGSSRLPGKVVADLGGIPMLAFLLRRLAPVAADHLVVATSESPDDDAVAQVAEAEGADVVRGPEQDVLARFAIALDCYPTDLVIRITGDCPLTDAEIVAAALSLARERGADYTSNTLARTFPDGLDVEVVTAEALRAAADEARDPWDREHVTPFVYRRPERFTLASLRHRSDLSHLRWTVDTADDLDRVRAIVERVGCLDFRWEEALGLT